MLLAKEGWLKKEEEPEVTGVVGNRRGGLGYDDKAASMRSEIIRKTLDRLNKFWYVSWREALLVKSYWINR